MLRKVFIVSFLFLLLAGTLVGANQEQPKMGGTLVLARTADATQLDPHSTTTTSSHRIFELVYNTLIGLGPDLLPVPELAESWTVNETATQYTFNLRHGVTFHNGQEMTAEDVLFTIERILDEETGAIARSSFIDVESMETPDPYTVVFNLATPNAIFVSNFADINTVIVAKDVAESRDINRIDNVIGTGPFKLAKWSPDEEMVMEKNPAYFEEGQPLLDEIVIKILPEEFSIVAALRTGTVDFGIVDLPTAAIALRQSPGVQLMSVPSLSYHPVFLNTSRPPLDVLEVRQAISYAIDRQALIDAAMLQEAVPAGPVSPALSYWALDLDQVPSYKPDPDRARELLQEAGYGDGFSLDLLFISGRPLYVAMGQVLQSQLREVGIEVNLKSLEYGIYVDRWLDADLDMAMSLNGGRLDPDLYLYRYFHSSGNLSFIHGHWSSARLDSLLDEGRSETDTLKRQAIYREAQTILIEGCPFIWLASPFNYFAMADNVRGFTPLPNGGIDYLKNVWIDQ